MGQELPPTLTDLFPPTKGLIISWSVGFVFLLAGLVVLFCLVRGHVRHKRTNNLRMRYTLHILYILPVFSISAYLSLFFPRLGVVLDLVRSCYEGFFVFRFFQLLVLFFGGPEYTVRCLRTLPMGPIFAQPPCCCCFRPCCPDTQITPPKLQWLARGALQICIVRPVASFLSLALYYTGVYSPGVFGGWFLVIRGAMSVSMMICIYCIIVVARVSLPFLTEFHIIAKFLTVKLLILISILQAGILSWLSMEDVIQDKDPFTGQTRATAINDFLLVIEVFFLSFLFRCAYPVSDHNIYAVGPRYFEEREEPDSLLVSGYGEFDHDKQEETMT